MGGDLGETLRTYIWVGKGLRVEEGGVRSDKSLQHVRKMVEISSEDCCNFLWVGLP